MSNLMSTILAGILPANKDRLYFLQEKVEDDFFTGYHRDIWQIFNKVGLMTGGEVATEAVIKRSLDGVLDLPIERRAAIEDTLEDIYNVGEVSDADFKASIVFLEEDYKKNRLGEGLSTAMEILTSGIRTGKDVVYGVENAIESLHSSISEIERVSHGAMPEGNIFEERLDLLRELQEGDSTDRILTGIRPLDEMTFGGAGAGELWLIAAYAGVGKTFFCTNLGYNFAVMEKKNVVYLTAETIRSQVRRRVLTRHARHPKFGFPNGLSSGALKKHSPDNPILTPEQIAQWHTVMEDMTSPHEKGIFHLTQIPMGAKISTIHAKLNKLNSAFPIDVVIVDSLDLLSPETKRSSNREELNDILASAKLLATSFDNGRGLRLISPWQTSRDAWKEAKSNGRYFKSSMAETSEAERKADLILALLEDDNHDFKLKAQTLKFRDATPIDFELDIDYDRGYVGSSDRIGSSFELDLLGNGGYADL